MKLRTENRRISMNIPEPALRKVRDIAFDARVSTSAIIRQAVDVYIRKQKVGDDRPTEKMAE